MNEKGTIRLGQEIRSMTSLPAGVFGMPDRGTLRVGAATDVVVFDLAVVRDVAEYTDLQHHSEGVVYVFLNGRAAISDGHFTSERAVRVLRKGL